MTTTLQAWIAVVGALLTAVLGIAKYFNYRTRRDRIALVGQSFREIVDALASDDEVKRLAAAILLRRFFDRRTEQGAAGTPYQHEAIRVIAAVLRGTEAGELQKLLADGLGYAPDLRGADLQGCNLENAYLGDRRKAIDISSNLAQRPEVAITIFDSSVPVGAAQAVYMRGDAEELTGANLERGIEIFGRVAEAGVGRRWALEDVQQPSPFRLYRATVREHSVLITGRDPGLGTGVDRRESVTPVRASPQR